MKNSSPKKSEVRFFSLNERTSWLALVPFSANFAESIRQNNANVCISLNEFIWEHIVSKYEIER